MAHNNVLQDTFLKELAKQKVAVSVFLVNGIKLHGVVGEVDDETLMLKNSVTQMVYKHAISTVVPSRAISLDAHNTSDE